MKLKLVHRNLKFSGHGGKLQTGPDVRAVQEAINRVCKRRGIHGIKVDGECGRHTIAKGRQAARALGLVLHHSGLTISTQRALRYWNLRTPAQRNRAHKWVKEHPRSRHASIAGNKVTGGKNTRDRIVVAAEESARRYATGRSHRFYSQSGRWTVAYGITGEPSDCRSDCSQFVTSIYNSAGAIDPNGSSYTGGYTGTLGGPGGSYISRNQLSPGDYVLYGPYPHHHVELYVGPGNRTIGHGSPPVDAGDIYMIADPHFYRPLTL